MSSPHWERVKEIFAAALERPLSERPAFVEAASGGDKSLRDEVVSLLSAHEDSTPFLETTAVARAAAEAVADGEGVRRIGPYRVVAEIGGGGMGVVFRAVRDDDAFNKVVALKLLRGGGDETFSERFRRERQILAGLEHPNIARLLDGGTAADGRPYFAMECVDGLPIDVYCATRGLGVPERIELVRTVCMAVAHAHHNLVVHRDLKPSNILVTPGGTPKLLDFGIAKILAPVEGGSGEGTVTHFPLMTPEYASPEQVLGRPVTTATDVYALGVLLYQLLAGRRPYDLPTRSAEELVRVVGTREPAAPSTVAPAGLRARLAGDLDTIVLKALRKEPERRYPSPESLSEDLRRYLAGLPVLARKDTPRYRAGKFVRRHRGAVLASAVLVLSLAAGLGTTFWQWRRAEAAHREAEGRFDDVRRLAGSLLFEIHDAIRDLPGSTSARELITARGVEYLDRLAATSADDRLRAELAAGYLRLGDVQGRESTASLGDASAATRSYRKAVALAEPLAERPGATVEDRALLARAYRLLSEALQENGEREEARALLAKALSLLAALVAADPRDPRLRDQLGGIVFDEAVALVDAANWPGALEAYNRCAAIYESLVRDEPGNPRHRRNVALMSKYQGGMSMKLGRTEDARRFYARAVAIDREIAGASPDDVEARLDLSFSLASLADVEAAAGRAGPALGGYQEALTLRREVVDADPANVHARQALARAHERVALMLARTGDVPAAVREQRRCVAEWETVAAASTGRLRPKVGLAQALADLGDLLSGHAGGRAGPASANGEACAAWRRGRQGLEGERDRLTSADRGLLDDLAARLARCPAPAGH